MFISPMSVVSLTQESRIDVVKIERYVLLEEHKVKRVRQARLARPCELES